MILLVENDEDDVFLMKRALQKASWIEAVHVSPNGQDARQYLEGTGRYADRGAYPLPSIIFLDIKLPIGTGFGVLEWIRQQPSLSIIPVVVLSSSPQNHDPIRARELGARQFVVKPPPAGILSGIFQSLAGDDPGQGPAGKESGCR